MKLVINKSLFFITFIGILFHLSIGSLDIHNNDIFIPKKSVENINIFSNKKFNKLNFFVETEKDSDFCVDEFEFEFEFNSYKQIIFENFYLEEVAAKKQTIFSCQFSSIKNKIPLYKLFCKWKLYTDLILV
ncbi:hypothetical protein [Flavobacterium sp.]|uniref:hypothetical protein n=1 Tax=Flavobacterium sp. TaxID=239 RepID=UPI00261CC724|nr:hypothetical protein [Flavobacterium sp.]